ncbi:hypothetical protein OB905_10805 [Halobacteria archaeon AArc-dxtr1]|nr:hypothetical protein [Halobacteria archaeon AArc-dxtr1]
MSKRSTKREIDKLTAERLEALEPLERVQIALRAHTRGRPGWLDRLAESRPAEQSEQVFRYGVAALELCHYVAYDLQTLALEYEREHRQWAVILSQIDDPSDEVIALAVEARTAATQSFAVLAAQARAADRFAEEVLGTDLETWFVLHPHQERLVETVGQTLDNEGERAIADRKLAEGTLFAAEADSGGEDEAAVDGDAEALTLEELADSEYERLVAMWDQLTDVEDAESASTARWER